MGIFKRVFSSKKEKIPGGKTNFAEGDLFYTFTDNRYQVYKLLVFDKDFDCYHVLAYEPLTALPDRYRLENLEVDVFHMPVDVSGFAQAVLLGNERVSADDLFGYHEYLRQTQAPAYLIPIAEQYYNEGITFTTTGMYEEAIDTYSKAIDLVPDFFEAIDNRAFCKMDLGRWEEAIADLRESLAVNPGNFLAEFSIGECYYNMGNYQKAKEQFEKACTIDPQNEASRAFLQKTIALLHNQ